MGRRKNSKNDGEGRSWAGPIVAGVIFAALASGAGTASHHHHHAGGHHGGQPAVVTAAHQGRIVAQAIAYARNQLGKPYCYGGTGPDCFDCSGLVMKAYAKAGVNIPRTSEQQWADLPHVAKPVPGDLVFFVGSPIDPSPGHVVLYIGHGEVIQAYATGYPVEISTLASLASSRFVGYARPVGGA